MTARDRARLLLLAAVATTVAVYAIPLLRPLAWPLLLLSTVAHELGHGVTALAAGGSFHRLMIFPDGSGVAEWSGGGGRLQLAAVAAGGLLGPALGAALLLAVGRRPRRAGTALGSLAVVLGLVAIATIRTVFGLLFVGVLAAVCGLVAARASRETSQLVLVFLALQLALSVFSRSGYLFTPVAQTGAGTMPSDVGQMANALWLPWWFWGALCGAASVVVVVGAFRAYWR